MKNNAVDFQKVRKKRQRRQTIKRLLTLGAVVGILALVVLVNNIFIEEGLTTRLSDAIGTLGGNGYPASLPGGIIRDVKSMGGNLTVLNDTNLYVYNKKGKQIQNIQQMSESTVILTNSDRVLVYDVGKTRFSVYSPTKQLYSYDLENRIDNAALGERGDFAVVISPRQYAAQIIAYNKQYKELGRFGLSSNLVSTLAMSPKGNLLVVASVNTNADGVLESVLHYYRFTMTQEAARVTLTEDLVLDMRFLNEDKIAVVTDRQYLLFNGEGVELGRYDFGGAAVSKVETSGNYALVLTEYRETRSQEAVLLDNTAKPVATLKNQSNIRDMALDSKHIYLLTDQGIDTYNRSFEIQKAFEQKGITRIDLMSGKLYYITPEEICLMDDGERVSAQEEPEEEDWEWALEELLSQSTRDEEEEELSGAEEEAGESSAAQSTPSRAQPDRARESSLPQEEQADAGQLDLEDEEQKEEQDTSGGEGEAPGEEAGSSDLPEDEPPQEEAPDEDE